MNQEMKKTLWAAADKLRSSMDAAEYKHIVLGLIFLKYISDAFDERRARLAQEFQNPKSDLYIGDLAQGNLLLGDLARVVWYGTPRESVRAKLRARVKIILKRHKYPPDMEQRAVELVLKQAEALAGEWVA